MFHIQTTRFHWIGDPPDDLPSDDSTDLCLHGKTTVCIGERTLSYDASVTSTALYLLKTLTEDHRIGEGNQLLPCCGHMWVPDEHDKRSVQIIGCNGGIDWSVTHKGDTVRLTLEDGYAVTLSLADYAAEVCHFADALENAYHIAPPRILPEDAFERDMFYLYWEEFHRRRGIHS